MYAAALPDDIVLSHLITLANQGKYLTRRHADWRAHTRRLNDDDVLDIMVNAPRILRVNQPHQNPNGIASYKIEGGEHKHRLAIQFVDLDSQGEITEDSYINIITVMDNQING